MKPIVEGSKNQEKSKGNNYCIELCSHCCNEAFNIPADRVSLCPHCEAEMFPCSGCYDDNGNADGKGTGGCSWDNTNLCCERFDHTNGWKRKEIVRRIQDLEEQRYEINIALASPECRNRIELIQRNDKVKANIKELEQQLSELRGELQMKEKWILISVCDREITVLEFDTKDAAYDKMIEELGFAAKGNISDYSRDNGEYDFNEDGAWLTSGTNQADFDWAIHGVSFDGVPS